MRSKVVVIVSRGRSRFVRKKNYTFSYITDKWDFDACPIVIFVREEEKEEYRKAILSNGLPFCLKTVPNSFGITRKRQHIMEWAWKEGYELVLHMDDDTQINPYNPNYSSKYAKGNIPKSAILSDMADQLFCMCCEKLPFNGLLFSQGSMNNVVMFSNKKKFFDVFTTHVPTWVKEGVRFDGLDPDLFMEDDYTIMLLREKGYQVMTNHMYTCGNTSRLKGGCESSGQRNERTQNLTAVAMKERFPGYITLVCHSANSYWPYPRMDIKVDTAGIVRDRGCPISKERVIAIMRKNGYKGRFFIHEEYPHV